MYRGGLSWRRLSVLVTQLPPGSRLQRARGGPGAWSDEVSAIHHDGYLTRTGIMSALGVKQSKLPKPVEPPAEGWKLEQIEKQRRAELKAARWKSRQH